MRDFIRNNPIWAAALALFVFLAWTVPLGIAAMWVLFQKDRTLVDWLASHDVAVSASGLIILFLFSVGTIVVISSFGYVVSIVKESGPWTFVPLSVDIRINNFSVDRLSPTYTEPYIAFALHVQNSSGRTIRLTGISGSLTCDHELCALPLALDRATDVSGGGRYAIYLRQGVSMDMARALLERMAQRGRTIVFDLSAAQFIGQIGIRSISIPLYEVTFYFKGPFVLASTNPASFHRFQPVLASTYHYDQFGERIRE